jgi:hypothetical protein
MKTWLSIITAASLLILPVSILAADAERSSSYQSPPVEQPLVREGDFAIKLAAELNLGTADDEETAVTLLAQVGVAPANGWLPDYPVTPQILGQLSEAITQAVADGSLRIAPGDADQILSRVAAEMSLPEPAGSAGTETVATAPSDAAVINTYYASEGPPIITYYAPPPQYLYLYDWVPYPAYWYGYWFSGFYICHNFTTTVFVTNNIHHGHGDFHGYGGHPSRHNPGTRKAIVSNHFRDSATGRRVFVDPIVKTGIDGVRPSTILRGEGRSYMTVADLHHGYAAIGTRPATNQARNSAERLRGGADRPTMHEQGRTSQSVFVRQNQSRTPQSPFVRQNDERTPRSAFVGQNNRPTSRSPFVGQNNRPTSRSPFVGQNNRPTSRSPFTVQNADRISRPSYMVQNQGHWSGSAALRGTGMPESARFNGAYAREGGRRAVVHGGVSHRGW